MNKQECVCGEFKFENQKLCNYCLWKEDVDISYKSLPDIKNKTINNIIAKIDIHQDYHLPYITSIELIFTDNSKITISADTIEHDIVMSLFLTSSLKI